MNEEINNSDFFALRATSEHSKLDNKTLATKISIALFEARTDKNITSKDFSNEVQVEVLNGEDGVTKDSNHNEVIYKVKFVQVSKNINDYIDGVNNELQTLVSESLKGSARYVDANKIPKNKNNTKQIKPN